MRPSACLATWFGSGLMPWAPGTWGSLAALPFAWAIAWAAGPGGLAAATVAVTLAGIWAGGAYARDSGHDDPGRVVIDEVAGQWLTLLPAPLDPWFYLGGFVLFRLLDVSKPWPASWADRNVKGGLGIMLDDVFAGAYGAIVMAGAVLLLGTA